MDELCSTCLSKHRTLVPLSTIDVISSHLQTIPFVGSVLVCWECNSMLQKMQAFKAQATKARELLKLYLEHQKSLKALQTLSRLSISSTKTDYDENFVYYMKQETMECDEEEDDFQSDTKYDTKEHIPKAEKVDIEIQDTYPYQLESPDMVNNCIQESYPSPLYITVAPLAVPRDRDGYHSDEWPLSEVAKETVCENESNIAVSRTAFTTLSSSDHVRPLFDLDLSQGTPVLSIQADSNNVAEINAPFSQPHPTGTEPRNLEIEQNGGNLSKDDDNFDIKIMSYEEMHKLRDEDRMNDRYLSCPFKCTTCITGYFEEEKYNAHLLIKHSEDIGPHTCDICLSRHKAPELLSRHRATHLRLYHCRRCAFATHKLQVMHSHQPEHGAQFTCQVCGFSTFSKGKLRYHMNKSHKEDPICKTCGKEFASVDGMRKHVLLKHNDGVTKLEKCAVCNGSYRSLAAHARSSCGPEAFCVECGVTFKNKLTYKQHLIRHLKHRQQNGANIRWHVCEECGYRCTNKSALTGHTAAMHTKQYAYNCDVCHKGFVRPSELRNHVLERHEGGERPRNNVCSYCGKAFKDKHVLINHIRTHTGERPFQCPHCPWSFAQRPALRTHMRAKHPGADITGNTGKSGVAGGSGNTDGGNADSGKGKNEP